MRFHQVIWMGSHSGAWWWHGFVSLLGAPSFQNIILIATAAIGLRTLIVSSLEERRRGTVDVLLNTLDNAEFWAARSKVREFIKAGLNIPYLLSDAGIADRRVVFSVLNWYEFMATGVQEGAFDTNLFQRMYHTNVITDWNDLEAFVLALRESRNNHTAFQEIQKLAATWKRDPLRAHFKLAAKVSQAVSLTVTGSETPTFTLSVLPASVSVAPGNNGTSKITTAARGGFDSPIRLTASGHPRGVNVRFSPASVAAPGSGTSTMKMAAASTTVPGTYSITVTGAEGWFRRHLRPIFRWVNALYSRLRRRA
jgi:hypothetical protein